MAVSTLLAGCSGSQDAEDDTPTTTTTSTPTDTPPNTPQDTDTPDEETPTKDDKETETEEEEENVARPADYQWDLKPGRNDALRSELGQYVSGSIGSVVQDHPAFEFSTDRENDDHTVDFEALKLYRDSNFDIMANDPNYDAQMEQIVQSFVDNSLYPDVKNDIYRSHPDSPATFSADEWLNAETVEDSLDLGHNYLISLDGTKQITVKEIGVMIREAYQRHHNFDVLAWEVPMSTGATTQGMMYSPDDDKVRSFATFGYWYGGGEAEFHTEIQDWALFDDPDGDAANIQHPILFHTDEWDRQGISFEDTKEDAVGMVFDIATDEYLNYSDGPDTSGIVNNITMTTGATEQLTRTLLDYNKSGVGADFEDIWNLASFAVGKYIDNPELNGVIDTVEPGEDTYDTYFRGGFAFYEVEDEDIVNEVRTDQAGEYDNFGEVYDELDATA